MAHLYRSTRFWLELPKVTTYWWQGKDRLRQMIHTFTISFTYRQLLWVGFHTTKWALCCSGGRCTLVWNTTWTYTSCRVDGIFTWSQARIGACIHSENRNEYGLRTVRRMTGAVYLNTVTPATRCSLVHADTELSPTQETKNLKLSDDRSTNWWYA